MKQLELGDDCSEAMFMEVTVSKEEVMCLLDIQSEPREIPNM